MKKLLLILAIAATVSGCKKDDSVKASTYRPNGSLEITKTADAIVILNKENSPVILKAISRSCNGSPVAMLESFNIYLPVNGKVNLNKDFLACSDQEWVLFKYTIVGYTRVNCDYTGSDHISGGFMRDMDSATKTF